MNIFGNSMTDAEPLPDFEDPTKLNEEWLARAKEELGETPETRMEGIKKLRAAIVDNGGVVESPEKLLRFLRAKKFRHDDALKMYTKYNDFVKKERFENIRASELRLELECGLISVLPDRGRRGERVVMFRAGHWDPKRVSPDQVKKALFWLLDTALADEETQIAGFMSIEDVDNAPFLSPSAMKALAKVGIEMIQDLIPGRMKRVFVLHEGWFLDAVMFLCKPLLSKKVRERLVMIGYKYEKIHAEVDPSHLPDYVGGSLPAGAEYKWVKEAILAEGGEWSDKLTTTLKAEKLTDPDIGIAEVQGYGAVVIDDMVEDSQAEKMGFLHGDMILKGNGKKIYTVAEWNKFLKKAHSKGLAIEVEVDRYLDPEDTDPNAVTDLRRIPPTVPPPPGARETGTIPGTPDTPAAPVASHDPEAEGEAPEAPPAPEVKKVSPEPRSHERRTSMTLTEARYMEPEQTE